MPELPEVQAARKQIEPVLLGRVMKKVTVAPDEIVLEKRPASELKKVLTGNTVVSTGRRGKHMWWVLESGPSLLFHFGMTGRFIVHDPTEAQRFAKLTVELDDKTALSFCNSRRLGRLRLREDPVGEPPLSKLGPDAYEALPKPAAFVAAVRKRKRSLKGILLDQAFLSGVGNWIADEVLYQAKLSPHRLGTMITEAEARALRSAIVKVLKRAVDVDADKDRFPKTWLFHHRWGKPEGEKTARGEEILYEDVAGRTTAWVPTRQR